MTSTKVADLTVDEFRALVQEIVVHTLSEMLGDPDEGAELREDFAEELRSALAAVEGDGETVPAHKVAKRLGLTW